MKKITLKLDSSTIVHLADFLSYSITNTRELGYGSSLSDKQILASLTELHSRICDVHNPYRIKYKIKICLSHGIGFMRHFERPQLIVPVNYDMSISMIAGQIDQQIN